MENNSFPLPKSVSKFSDYHPITFAEPERVDPEQLSSQGADLDSHRHLAQVSGGSLTHLGFGFFELPDNEKKTIGIELLKRAAEENSQPALVILALLFMDGILVKKNWSLAMNYLLRDHAMGLQQINDTYQTTCNHDYDSQMTKVRNCAFVVLKNGAKAGIPNAMYSLAMLLLKGVLRTDDPMLAINDLLRPASRSGHREASHELGMMQLEGRYGTPQSAKGIYYLQRAAYQGREEKFLIKETVDVPVFIKESIPQRVKNTSLAFIQIKYKGKLHWAPQNMGINSTSVKKLLFANGKEYFYKPFYDYQGSLGISALNAGIPINVFARNIPYRAMFAYHMAKHLGFQVIPKTGLICIGNDFPGYILEKAPGASGYQLLYALARCNDIGAIKSNVIIGRKLAQLQLVDAITGEPDRHGNNYHINLETNEVFGFDNDYCGGKNITHPYHALQLFRYDGFVPGKLTDFEKNLIHAKQIPTEEAIAEFLNQPDSAGRGVLLPPIMDEDMVEQLSYLTNEDLVRIMAPLYFTDAEIKAAYSRLKVIHNHIAMLEQRQKFGGCAIIKPDEWGSPKVQEIMYPDASGNAFPIHTNYLSREIAIASGKNRYKDLIADWTPVGGKKNAHDLLKMSDTELKRFKISLNLA